MDPVKHGGLRYTLVEIPNREYPFGGTEEPVIKAIYHHVGLGIDLPTDYSEGVLLLPEKQDAGEEARIVSSLLGLLWQVRSAHTRKRKPIMRRILGLP